MQKRISTLPFQGTKEQQEQLFKVIDENGGTHGSVMPILQKAQEIYGYLPIEVQTMIAEKWMYRWKKYTVFLLSIRCLH